jgi:GT2 family glycosyltransferase
VGEQTAVPDIAVTREGGDSVLRACLMILNWNGLALLEQCVPTALAAVKAAGGGHEVLVVDNGSADGSQQYVRRQFPEVRLLELPQNFGYATGNNLGVQQTDCDIVCLINNDNILHEQYLNSILPHFEDPAVFAVTPRFLRWDRSTFAMGRRTGRFRFGFLCIDPPTDEVQTPSFSLYASGGGGAFRRQQLLELGGIDPKVSPYYEDVDLGYRAWQRGWKVIYEPRSLVYEDTSQTMRRIYNWYSIRAVTSMNHQLFNLKNITERRYVIERTLAYLPLLALSPLLGRPFVFFAPGFLSLLRWGKLFSFKGYGRRHKHPSWVRSASEVVRLSRAKSLT